MEHKHKFMPQTHTRQYWYEEADGFYQTKKDCGCDDLKTKVNKNTSTNKKQTDDLKNIQEGLKNIQLVKKEMTDNSIVYSFTNSSKKEITFEIPTSFEDIYLEKAEYDNEKKVIVFTLVNGTTLTLDPKDMMGEFISELSGQVITLSGDVINISGDVITISENVEALMADSAHTVVEGDEEIITVKSEGKTYTVSANVDAIKSVIEEYLTDNDYVTSGDVIEIVESYNYVTSGDVINIVSGISGDVATISGDVETLKANSAHTVVVGDNTVIDVAFDNDKTYTVSANLSAYTKTEDLSGVIEEYLTDNNYVTSGDVINIVSGISGDVINIVSGISGDVATISGDVETLKANSAHTTVSEGDNIIVVTPSNGKPTNYAISVDINKLSEELDQTHTTVSEGDNVTVTKSGKDYKVSVPNSAITNVVKNSVKVVNGTNTTVTEGTDGDAKTYAVNVDLSEYAKASALTECVTGGSITSSTNGYSATVENGVLNLTVPAASVSHVYSGDDYITVDNTGDTITFNASKLELNKYITSGTIGASADGYSATVTNGVLNLTVPAASVSHVYKGDGTYITVTSDDTITFNTNKLPIAISSVTATYSGTTPSGSFKDGILTISYPQPEGSITSGSITSSTNGYSATVENKTLKLTVPEVKTLTGTSVSASTDGKYHLDLNSDKTQLDFKYPNAEVYSAKTQFIGSNEAINLSADTNTKEFVLSYPIFAQVDPQNDFGTSQDNYGKITTAVSTVANNGKIGVAIETIEKSISGTQQVLVDDELIFEKAIENMAKASGLLFDNIIKYVPYTEIDTCIESATSLYTAQVALAKEVRNLWVAFNDIKTKLGI